MMENAPTPEFARPGANPTLRTIEFVRAVLQRAHGPVSRQHIHTKLSAWGHGTSKPSLNAALAFLAAEGAVVEGSKGLQWAHQAEGSIHETIRRKRS